MASIPNARRLWRLFHDDPAARLVWRSADICRSMLSESNTAADRRAVFERDVRYNGDVETVRVHGVSGRVIAMVRPGHDPCRATDPCRGGIVPLANAVAPVPQG